MQVSHKMSALQTSLDKLLSIEFFLQASSFTWKLCFDWQFCLFSLWFVGNEGSPISSLLWVSKKKSCTETLTLLWKRFIRPYACIQLVTFILAIKAFKSKKAVQQRVPLRSSKRTFSVPIAWMPTEHTQTKLSIFSLYNMPVMQRTF